MFEVESDCRRDGFNLSEAWHSVSEHAMPHFDEDSIVLSHLWPELIEFFDLLVHDALLQTHGSSNEAIR